MISAHVPTSQKKCIESIIEEKTLHLVSSKAPEPFHFDYVAGEDVTQDDIF
jgi:hypothetical protein